MDIKENTLQFTKHLAENIHIILLDIIFVFSTDLSLEVNRIIKGSHLLLLQRQFP